MYSFDSSKLKASAAEYSSEGDESDSDLLREDGAEHSEFAQQHRRKRRRTGREAKESAALGIFGSDSDEDGGWRFKRKALRAKGVIFVSSVAGERAKDFEDEGDEDEGDEADSDGVEMEVLDARKANAAAEKDEENVEDSMAGAGLGFDAAAVIATTGSLGTPNQHSNSEFSANPSQNFFQKSKHDATSIVLDTTFTPSSAKQSRLRVLSDEDEGNTAPRRAMPSAFSQTRGAKTKINTKGFGARMMARMGYVNGTGLGKEGQGRNVIIEANLRPQGVGLGAVKEKSEKERQEEKRQAKMRGEVVVDSDEEKKKQKAAESRKKALQGGVGASSGISTPRRRKPAYVTLEEARKAAPGLHIPEAFTPILDMTGPGKKMLTSASGIMTSTRESMPEETAEAAEARKLVRRAQNDFMAILEEWQSLQERKAFVDLQLKQEQQELDELQFQLDGNRSITNQCEEISRPPESGELDKKSDLAYKLSKVLKEFKAAQESLSDALLPSMRQDFSTLVVAAIHPLFKEYVQLWDPLSEPKPPFLEPLTALHRLLLDSHEANRKAIASPYETMIYTSWLPKAAAAVRAWNVRDPDQLLTLYTSWQSVLPPFVRFQLVNQDIVRRLEDAVAMWEPKRKKAEILPHLYIFPWLEHLPAHHVDPKSSTGLVADVKRKFRQLIDVWEFSRLVIPGLRHWKPVLRPCRAIDHWDPLVMNHVLPSMARYLRKHFRVNPQDQEPYLPMLEGVFAWHDLIPYSFIGEVIVAEVFPMFHDVLHQWLVGDPNYDEIGAWLTWWQEEVFPDEIKTLPSIVAEFKKGEALIEEALNLGDEAVTKLRLPGRGPALPAPVHGHMSHHAQERTKGFGLWQAKPPPADVTFRHVVEDWCQENDLQFIPERKKVHAEGPLYRITARGDGRGGVLVYFKGDRLVAEVKNGDPMVIRRDQDEMVWGALLELAS